MADADNFKSTYEILLDISKVWDKLTDVEQATLLERIAGKHRASAVAAILNDTDTLVKAYETALNSSGSAMEEFEKRTKSIEYHLQQLNATWQELATNTVTVEFVNSLIDAARAMLEFVNNVGLLNIVGTLVGSVAAIFGKLKIAPYFDSMGKKIAATSGSFKIFGKELNLVTENLGETVKGTDKVVTKNDVMARSFAGLATTLKTAGKAIFASFGIGLAFTAVISIIDNLIEKFKETKYVVSNLATSIHDLEANVSSYKTELQELYSKDIKTGADVERIEFLKEQIALEEELIRIQKERLANTTVNEVSKYYSGDRSGVNSEFMDNMDKMNALIFQFDYNSKELDNLKKSIDNTKASMEGLATTDSEYIRLSEILATQEKQLIILEDQQLEYRSEAVEQLQELVQKRSALTEIIENSTGAQKQEAIASRDALDADIANYKQKLGLTVATKDLTTTILRQKGELNKLNTVIGKVNNGQEVSKEELEELAEIYPDLSELVKSFGDSSEDSFELSEEALDSLNVVQAEAVLSMIDNQIALTEAVIAESKIRIQQYRDEQDELRSLNSALYAGIEEQRKSDYNTLFEKYHYQKDGKWQFKGRYTREEYEAEKAELAKKYSSNSSDSSIASYYRQEEYWIKKEEEELAKHAANAENLSNLYEQRKSAQEKYNELVLAGIDENENPGLGDPDTSAADIFDKYANALAKAREEIERYGAAVELAQAQLDLNQSQEERSVELLGEEQELYGKLLEAQQARYKIVNDTLWLQQQQLKAVKEEASQKVSAKLGTDVDVSNWTQADVEEFVYNLKVDTSEADADLANFLNAMIEMQGDVDKLYVDWYNMKKEIRETELEQLQKVIDFQNDSLEQFDDARKQTEKILSLLEEVEDTEDERLNIVKNLSDSYEGQKETIMAMHQANVAQMHELAQDMERNQQAYNRLVEQNQKLEEDYLDVIQAQLNYKQQQIDLEQELAEKRAESEIYGDKGKDRWEDARQDEIDALNDQIDELNKKAEEDDFAEQMAEYEKDIAEKEQEIADLYKKLDNLRSQKTVQTLEQQADGSFQWKYVEDQIAINETLEEIADKEVEIEELKNEKKEAEEKRALEEEIAHLEAQIEAIEDEVERRQQLFDEELQVIEDTYQKEKAKLAQWLQDEITHWQTRVAENEKGLASYDAMNTEGWNLINTNTDAALTDLEGTYDLHFQNIVTIIGNHAATAIAHINAIAAAQRRAAEAAREAAAARASADSADGSHAMGLRFVEANNYVARLHYGERVLTRQEAQQYNELEDDIKSGHLKAYFDSMKQETADRISTGISTSVARIGSSVPMAGNNSSTSFVIEHLELPNVQDAQDFANVLQRWAKQEFGGLAQKAKIVKAR